MCRHLVGLGPSRTLAELLIDPPYGLYPPSWAPRRKRHGTVTADGFGIAWYQTGGYRLPARYRRAVPIRADGNLPGLARSIHNGAVEDWTRLPHDTGTLQTADELPGPGACCGSALLWALVHSRIAARWGHTLGCRATADHVGVTSEPVNDADDWQDVPDQSLLMATRTGVETTPLRLAAAAVVPVCPCTPEDPHRMTSPTGRFTLRHRLPRTTSPRPCATTSWQG
ncbi:hypothetical protein [Streptomyces tailanensis]|uniref:hypothetical protein n=1 Tax=Streptomyces tailanensis TaxID=2569858 RepID=UPI001C0EBC94|nr:hypothetical protein [Streptomyces tailanensis]